MIVRIVAASAVAAAVILLTWAVYRTRGRPMPKAAWPILIGGSLIGYGVYDEYSWRSRTVGALPENVVVVGEGASRSPLSPWSYLLPRTDRLSLIDTERVRTHPNHPELRLVEIALLERMHPTLAVNEIVDCETGRGAAFGPNPTFDEDGIPTGVGWRDLGADDPRIELLCDDAAGA